MAAPIADGGSGRAVAGCPEAMVRIGRYCVDRWEAHLVQVAAGGATAAHPHTRRPARGVRYEARSAAGVFPQAYVNRIEAKQACENAGKRLCTWIEWRRACQGKRWLQFPYGWGFKAGRCNSGKLHLLPHLFGDDVPRWDYEEHFNSPRLNAEPGYLAKTGQYGACVGPEGIHDMVGNLHEWVSGTVTERFMERIEGEPVERIEQPWRVGNGMFLGGFYSTTHEHGPGCHFVTVAHEPSYHDYSTGFRCCVDAEPDPGEPGRNPAPR